MTDTLHMLTNNKPIPINLASKMFGIDFWKSFINDDVSGEGYDFEIACDRRWLQSNPLAG